MLSLNWAVARPSGCIMNPRQQSGNPLIVVALFKKKNSYIFYISVCVYYFERETVGLKKNKPT
jgi:hypothetical protein